MSIKVTVPRDRLDERPVAEALARLLLAMGEVGAKRGATAPRVQTVAPVAAPPVAQPGPSLLEFVEGMPANTRRFMQLLQRRGRLTVSEVVAFLGLSTPKAVGGITGAIARWAPVRGLPMPFEAIKLDGERAWRWIATDAPDLGDPGEGVAPPALKAAKPAQPAPKAAKPAAKPTKPTERAPKAAKPARPTTKAAKQAPKAATQAPKAAKPAKAAPVQAPQAPPGELEVVAGLHSALSGKALSLMDLIHGDSQVHINDACTALGLSKGSAVGALVREINAAGAALGIAEVVVQSVSATGSRIYGWYTADLSTPAPRYPTPPGLTPVVAPSRPAEAPKRAEVPKLPESVSQERPSSMPGVRRRRANRR